MTPVRILLFSLLILSGTAQPLAVLAQGTVKFVSGGIGLEEREALAVVRDKFSARVTAFVPKGGNYLADVAVSIRDAVGRELLVVSMEGPFLYAELPPGAYSLSARFQAQSLERKFTVPRSGAIDVYLPFDDPTAHWEKGMEPERERKPGSR